MARPEHEDDELNDDEDAPASPSTLKLLAHYVMLGFAPFVAVVALMFALISIVRVPAMQVKVSDTEAQVKKLETELNSSRLELTKLKTALQQERTARAQDNQKRDALSMQIIDSITQLQTKLKIHPTLTQQVHETSAGAPAASGSGPVPDSKHPGDAKNGEAVSQARTVLQAIKKFNEE